MTDFCIDPFAARIRALELALAESSRHSMPPQPTVIVQNAILFYDFIRGEFDDMGEDEEIEEDDDGEGGLSPADVHPVQQTIQ